MRFAAWRARGRAQIGRWLRAVRVASADFWQRLRPFLEDCRAAGLKLWQARLPEGPSLLSLTPYELKLLLIAIPVSLSTIYLVLFAANRYESEAIVSVRQVGQETTTVTGIAAILGGNPTAREDVLYLQKFMHSNELAQRLDKRLGLSNHYGSTYRDVLGRLWEFSSREAYLEHFRSRVGIVFDDLASTLTIRVQGYDPDTAKAIADAVLAESEAFVNDYSHKIARDRLGFAERELEQAGGRVQKAKEELLLYQRANQLLDPLAQAKAASSIYAELAAQLSRLEAELKNKQAYLASDSFEVRGLKDQIRAIERQIRAEGERTTAQGKDAQLNEQAARFQDLLLRVEFAQESYKLALAALESARIDSTRKAKTLVVIEPPSLPDSARYPERLYWILTIFIVGLLLYAIARVVIATLLEHQDPHASS